MHILKATKFFDIKMPQVEAKQDFYNNAGIDLFMPRPTVDFAEAFIKANEKLYGENTLEIRNLEETTGNKVDYFEVVYTENDNDFTIMKFEDGKYTIFYNCTIPLGFSLDIPQGMYCDLRSKSSNFGFAFSEVTGLIDCCYTYGWSVQIFKLNSGLPYLQDIEFAIDQKIAQLVMLKNEEINDIIEISQTEWDADTEIKNKREKRIGGFGSTGTHAK